MNEGKGNNVLLVIVAIATLLVAVIGATFAFFTAIVSGQEETETMRINSGTIGTEFVGGSAISQLAAQPQEEPLGEKEFTLTGVTKTDAKITYKLGLVVSKNSFVPGALKYKLSHHEDSTDTEHMAPEIELTDIPVGGVENLGEGIFQGPIPVEEPIVHKYVLGIYFPETGVDQNDNQEKELNAHIKIDDPTTTTSTTPTAG